MAKGLKVKVPLFPANVGVPYLVPPLIAVKLVTK